MSNKRRNLTHEEQSLWDRFVQKIKPITSDKKPVTSKLVQPRLNRHQNADTPYPIHTPKSPAKLTHRIDRIRKVKIDARFDLHGLTLEQAHRGLTKFLVSCQKNHCLWVLVITGKGKPRVNHDDSYELTTKKTLRSQVPHWLEEAPLYSVVSAYTTAKPQDGGSGALYVRLKRLK